MPNLPEKAVLFPAAIVDFSFGFTSFSILSIEKLRIKKRIRVENKQPKEVKEGEAEEGNEKILLKEREKAVKRGGIFKKYLIL
ncbi:MAG: hypothetical protein Q4A19_00050 [Johnsonella sp.]|nr:hypothetical protein [Johnsonella sp.]